MLAFKQQCPMVDFRQVSENEGKEKLLNLAQGYLQEYKLAESGLAAESNKTGGKRKKNTTT
jgi:hypothetical protein